MALPENSSFQLTNPYEKDVVHFLQIWVKAEQSIDSFSSQLYCYDLSTPGRALPPIVSAGNMTGVMGRSLPFSCSIGRFSGRAEAKYQLQSKASLFFAFVLAGAFEVEDRLLHEKDGLALWELEEVESEALSYNAMMLVMELLQE